VRVVPAQTPPEIVAIETDPRVSSLLFGDELAGRAAGHFYTVVAIPGTRGWLAGVVVPEELYLGGLAAARDRWLLAAAAVIALILTGGSVALRTVRRALGAVVAETARMSRFEFAATAHPRTPFVDVADALASLEQAKTALRAMGKYVPVDLVRQLYAAGREPELGGEPAELTMMFTDIADFTTVAEALPPDRLAHALGRYLEVMAGVVASHGGTVDKYIGDAVMALWNAPLPVADHAARACRAALACVAALEELYASEEWRGLPRWTTRFGLHTDVVLVGHFGAPDRLSYTALGDGVNLASRLEGLNKSLGTTILASEATVRAAGGALPFRRVARTAVKGRVQELEVYALGVG
jgi:adenylate cyclase